MQSNRKAGSQNVDLGLVQDGLKQRYLVLRFLVAASGSCAWSSLKNCIKILLGRNTHFDQKGLFLRQYVLHLTGLRPIRKVTCTGLRTEGAGSQALMIM